ncbi:MAG: cobalt-precorrin-5B (C(1))-methyltransferase [Desulfuromonadales bacterium]|nr:cobalt-precorrin-5B (C(1))-methyltransferase [Desulfuromonadales bacterium]
MTRRKKLRSGYTTGACAAAASLGAALLLRDGGSLASVELLLPAGDLARFALAGQAFSSQRAHCFVVKDAGDDPDVTHGVEVHAELRWVARREEDLELAAGIGIGQVTKPGLAVSVGAPAINPVPRQMITEAVRSVFPQIPDGKALQLTLSIPDGVARAKKTLNERLGIVGGLSLLGTTGVVRPVSHKAWTDTLDVALDVALAARVPAVVLSTGRTSELAARELNLPEEAYIMMGDFIGYCLEACHRKGVPEINLAAQFAKLVKIACGHHQTHARNAELDLDRLRAWGEEIDLDAGDCERLELAHTAREVYQLLGAESTLVSDVAARALALMREQLPAAGVKIQLVDYQGKIVKTFSKTADPSPGGERAAPDVP